MERKQGFFAMLRDKVARRLLPARAGARRKSEAAQLTAAPRCARGGGEALSPLMEGPDPGNGGGGRARKEGWSQSSVAAGSGAARKDLKLILGVMGAPLGPVHVCTAELLLPDLSFKDNHLVSPSWCITTLYGFLHRARVPACSRSDSVELFDEMPERTFSTMAVLLYPRFLRP
jgi:hypothetical protein